MHVEPQVLELLAHLLAHRDRMVPKTELLDVVWGDRFVSESALTSRIKQARRAVGDDGQRQRSIATVHGRGYRFVAAVDAVTTGDDAGSVAPRRRTPPGPHRSSRTCGTASPATGSASPTPSAGAGPPLVKAANWFTHLEHEWHSPIWSHWLHDLARRHELIRYDERGAACRTGTSTTSASTPGSTISRSSSTRSGSTASPSSASPRAAPSPSPTPCATPSGSSGWCSPAPTPGAASCAPTPRRSGPRPPSTSRSAASPGAANDDAFRQLFASQFLPDGSRELWHAFNELQRVTTSTDNVVRFLDVFAHIDVSALLPLVQCPTLVFHSRGDLRVPGAQARELVAGIPNSRLVVLNSANHILTADEPAWGVFLHELDRFLG